MAEVLIKKTPPPFRVVPTTPIGKPSKAKSARFTVLITLVIEGIKIAGINGAKTPGWVFDLISIVEGGASRKLNTRYRLRSCECCAVVASRVTKYLVSGRIDSLCDNHALSGDDDVERFYGNRKSRAN